MENYQDNPKEIEEWVEKLTDKEYEIFNRGFVCALNSTSDLFVDTKTKLLNFLFDLANTGESTIKTKLEAKIELLDAFENHYRKRIGSVAATEETL